MSDIVMIDASTYQQQIFSLAEVMAQKVLREGDRHIAGPAWFHSDIFISLRQAKNTYGFLHWAHSDEQRQARGWKDEYTFAAIPLVRNLIDTLYNITLLLKNPYINGRRFRVSGLRKGMLYLDAEEARYKGKPEWDKYVADGRKKLDLLVRASGFTMADVLDTKQFPNWPTLGKYIQNGPLDEHKKFLQTFSFGPWKQYSAVAHGGPEGLHQIGTFLYRDGHPHEERHLIDEAYPGVMSMHMMRVAILMLAIITEVQASYRFKDEGARINERAVECWQALQPSFEGKEIYEEHYAQLMKDKGIS